MPSGPGPFGPPYHVAVPPSRHPSPSSARAAPRCDEASANANARRCVVRDARGARRAVRVAESRSGGMSCRFARRSFRVGPEREARCEAGARLVRDRERRHRRDRATRRTFVRKCARLVALNVSSEISRSSTRGAATDARRGRRCRFCVGARDGDCGFPRASRFGRGGGGGFRLPTHRVRETAGDNHDGADGAVVAQTLSRVVRAK